MSPAARRILDELAADEHCDLIRDGIHAYCGQRPVASRVVSELVWCSAVSPVVPSGGPGATYYAITNLGRAYRRRPELADEYRLAVMSGNGSFTIKDDRIVPLDPEPARPSRSRVPG